MGASAQAAVPGDSGHVVAPETDDSCCLGRQPGPDKFPLVPLWNRFARFLVHTLEQKIVGPGVHAPFHPALAGHPGTQELVHAVLAEGVESQKFSEAFLHLCACGFCAEKTHPQLRLLREIDPPLVGSHAHVESIGGHHGYTGNSKVQDEVDLPIGTAYTGRDADHPGSQCSIVEPEPPGGHTKSEGVLHSIPGPEARHPEDPCAPLAPPGDIFFGGVDGEHVACWSGRGVELTDIGEGGHEMPVGIGFLQDVFVHKGQIPDVRQGLDIPRADSRFPVEVTVEWAASHSPVHQVAQQAGLDLLQPFAGHGLDLCIPVGTVGHKRKFRVPSFGFRVKG